MKNKKIGFLGPRGTFSEEAMKQWLIQRGKKEVYDEVEYCSIPELICAVGLIDEAVVPVENTIEGSVNITIDLLIRKANIKVKGESVLPIQQNLLVKGSLSQDNINTLYSHPHALYQCWRFISEKMPRVRTVETSSTAEAARIVCEKGNGVAAIGSRRLAEIYNLDILAETIQDYDNNLTRFYILSSHDAEATGRDKTVFVFSTENRPASLFNCLEIFAKRNLNLTKIESRPSKRSLGEYIFFIEVEGHREDVILKTAFAELESKAGFFRNLGSFPSSR
jgi:prephenate dehydratase